MNDTMDWRIEKRWICFVAQVNGTINPWNTGEEQKLVLVNAELRM